MSANVSIRQQIEQIVGNDFQSWKIGLTDNPTDCRRLFGTPLVWFEWRLDSTQSAKHLLSYFFEKGMRIDACIPCSANRLYLFNESQTVEQHRFRTSKGGWANNSN